MTPTATRGRRREPGARQLGFLLAAQPGGVALGLAARATAGSTQARIAEATQTPMPIQAIVVKPACSGS
jgi:hypothetical protein